MSKINFENVKLYEGHSQKKQHCYINHVFDSIGTTNKYYLDIGAYDGVTNSNVIDLKIHKGWDGLMIDNNCENSSLNLKKHTVTKDNICDILTRYEVPKKIDFLSLDVDGMDYWILKSVLSQYQPRLIVVESNVRFSPHESKAMKYNSDYCWDGLNWYGASPLAFKNLANKFNYTPVYVLNDDIFIIHNDDLDIGDIEKPWLEVYSEANLELYKDHVKPHHPTPILEPIKEEWMDV